MRILLPGQVPVVVTILVDVSALAMSLFLIKASIRLGSMVLFISYKN